MPLEPLGFVGLPVHVDAGGFDRAAVHGPTGLIYVAHTANDAVDVIAVQAQRGEGRETEAGTCARYVRGGLAAWSGAEGPRAGRAAS